MEVSFATDKYGTICEKWFSEDFIGQKNSAIRISWVSFINSVFDFF